MIVVIPILGERRGGELVQWSLNREHASSSERDTRNPRRIERFRRTAILDLEPVTTVSSHDAYVS